MVNWLLEIRPYDTKRCDTVRFGMQWQTQLCMAMAFLYTSLRVYKCMYVLFNSSPSMNEKHKIFCLRKFWTEPNQTKARTEPNQIQIIHILYILRNWKKKLKNLLNLRSEKICIDELFRNYFLKINFQVCINIAITTTIAVIQLMDSILDQMHKMFGIFKYLPSCWVFRVHNFYHRNPMGNYFCYFVLFAQIFLEILARICINFDQFCK